MNLPRILLLLCLACAVARAQTPEAAKAAEQAKSPADVITFTNGDQISGRLERADNSNVLFKSDMLGELTVAWKQIKILKTAEPYVIVSKNKHAYDAPLEIEGQRVEVPAQAGESIPLDQTVMIVDPTTYQKQVARHPEFWQGWTGTLNGGLNIIEATQNQQAITAAATAIRTTPTLSWLAPKQRTTLSFQGNFGTLTQVGEPTVRTGIFHALGEEDDFFSKRLFGYLSSVFDHNIAQSLSLQQAYGGGLGVKVLTRPNTQLEFKGDLHYTRQTFEFPELHNNLLASSFSVLETHKFPRAIVWTNTTSVSPSYNRSNAFQMSASSAWTVPVYKSLGLQISLIDNYLNNPQPGFLKNSLQFTSGIQWSFK